MPKKIDPAVKEQDETADVIVADDRLRWLFHPHGGGLDVVTRSSLSTWSNDHPARLSTPPGVSF